MSDFPRLIEEAAKLWPSETAAFEQITLEGGKIKVRIQAIDIMQQFVGDVSFGRDPKGLLFYTVPADFNLGQADFKYTKYGTGSSVTVQTDFYEEGKRGKPFARFLARVNTDTYKLPATSADDGSGKWTAFQAATSQTIVVRLQGSTRLNLRFPPVGKRVFFEVQNSGSIADNGVLIFRDIRKLVDVSGTSRIVADYAPDRIVFHPSGDTSDKAVVALFLPAKPLAIGDSRNSQTTWRPDEPDFAFVADEEEA
ncbi:hypothetical protein BJV74DRAFT_857014 [Russula compacta]|nr:hypothetical protein BJV74DRAFT_857014 [Russula compacta]